MGRSLMFLLFVYSLYFGQAKEFPLKHEDFSRVVINKEVFFEGIISKETPIKLKLNGVVKNPEKPNIYLVSGFSDVEGSKAEFLGELIFNEKYDVKDQPDQMLVFGDFYLIETRSGEHSGTFKGKFRIQTHKNLNADIKETFSTLTFKGKWENYVNTLEFDVGWANYNPNDISKVVFK